MSLNNSTLKNPGIIFLILALAVVFSSCQSEPALEPVSTTESVSVGASVVPTAQTPLDDAVQVVQDPRSGNECLVCHSDQQALIDSAKPQVVVASENSGEG